MDEYKQKIINANETIKILKDKISYINYYENIYIRYGNVKEETDRNLAAILDEIEHQLGIIEKAVCGKYIYSIWESDVKFFYRCRYRGIERKIYKLRGKIEARKINRMRDSDFTNGIEHTEDNSDVDLSKILAVKVDEEHPKRDKVNIVKRVLRAIVSVLKFLVDIFI